MLRKLNYFFFITVIASISCNSNTDKNQKSDTSRLKKDSVASISNQNIIRLDLESVDLIIDSSTTGKVNVIKGYNQNEVTYKETISEDEIEIVSKGKSAIVSNPGKIELQVPENCTIICNLMSGNTKVNKISCNSIIIESMSGYIKIKGIVTKSAKIKTMSGEIYYNGRIDKGNTTLNTMSGDINIILDKESSLKLELSSEKANVFYNERITKKGKFTKTIRDGSGFLLGNSMSGDVNCITE